MYFARIDEDELYELFKQGYFIDGWGNDRDKPIKVLYTGNYKPILYFSEDKLKLVKEIYPEAKPILIRNDMEVEDVFELLNNDNIEALVDPVVN